jgi:cyclohexanecarboxylate-CoA ligase/acyl-CoA synthetase
MNGAATLKPESAKTLARRDNWSGRTILDAFDEALGLFPDKTLVVAGDIRLSYAEVADQIERLAAQLAQRGLAKGDVVSIQLPNWAQFLVIYLAATRLGAVVNTLLPIYRMKELTYILSKAKTKMLFGPGLFRGFDYRPLYSELKEKLPTLQDVIIVGGGCPEDMIAYEDLASEPPKGKAPRAQIDADDVNILLFTSGTESNPKGVIHTHNTMSFGNHAVADLLNLNSDEVIWAVSPVGHATGMQWTVRQAVMLGATVVMQEAFDPAEGVDLIEKERCSFTVAATPFASMLADVPGVETRDLSAFRNFLCGGATVPSSLGNKMREKIGCTLLPLWGMSECFIATLCSPDDPEDLRFGTDGKALPGVEMAIFDSDRAHVLPAGQEGEIATRGPHVCLGYFKDPERTADTFRDGWLFSNDLGVMNEQGYIRVLGRIKDIINRGGLKISASEIEDMLLKNPMVKDIAIVGVPDDRLGEKSCACVIPDQHCTVTLADLVGTLKEIGVASYKLPEYIAIVQELPMTATGKVQKFQLRDALVSGKLTMGSE